MGPSLNMMAMEDVEKGGMVTKDTYDERSFWKPESIETELDLVRSSVRIEDDLLEASMNRYQ